jgi:glycosyltransferase involved in cell wall biosynthesis
MIELSVIIPAYNASKRISFCVESLLTQKTSRKYEVIVVDDGSTDGIDKVLSRYPVVRLLKQKNSGPGTARNLGVKEAQGKIVLFTDDDCIAEEDWIDRMAEAFDDREVVGVKGTYLTRQEEPVARFVQIEYEEKYDVLSKHKSIDFIDTYSAGFRRKTFLEAGGYHRRFRTASVEDQEFSFRLARRGYKMLFVPEAKVWHSHVDSALGYMRKKIKIGYWKVLALKRNPGKTTGDSHTPQTLKMQILFSALLLPSFALPQIPQTGISWPLAVVILFFLTTIPLTARALRKDFTVGLRAPFYISLRAVSLLIGLILGGVVFLVFGKR